MIKANDFEVEFFKSFIAWAVTDILQKLIYTLEYTL